MISVVQAIQCEFHATVKTAWKIRRALGVRQLVECLRYRLATQGDGLFPFAEIHRRFAVYAAWRLLSCSFTKHDLPSYDSRQAHSQVADRTLCKGICIYGSRSFSYPALHVLFTIAKSPKRASALGEGRLLARSEQDPAPTFVEYLIYMYTLSFGSSQSIRNAVL